YKRTIYLGSKKWNNNFSGAFPNQLVGKNHNNTLF
ncbi:hypothetical protein M080_1681, partial [Bacteroides fragilis str. 3397 T10]